MSHWGSFIKKCSESPSNDYIEICMCHNPERYLRFDINTKEYYGVGGCDTRFVCAMLQIEKHRAIISSRKKKFAITKASNDKKESKKKRKGSQDLTLDQFFKKPSKEIKNLK